MKFKIPDMEKEQPELFKWWDACSEINTEVSKLKKAKDTRDLLAIRHTIGYKVAEDKHAIIIATEVSKDDNPDDVTMDTTRIPKKWLIK